MAEGGGIDHLAHANDAAGVIRETKEFDTAIRVAYEFYRQHPKETLIIVTADHETGGLGLGVKESSYKQHMDYIQHVSVSKMHSGTSSAKVSTTILTISHGKMLSVL